MPENFISTTPKPFVFVLMPFDKKFDDVYKLGIKSACQETGAYCERVDEQIFTESILAHIYNQISKADIIVSDMTSRNPNVFYETGYAHAMGKVVILLVQDASDIPFDMKHYPHIIYGSSISTLKDELSRRIIWSIENPNRELSNTGYDLNFRLWGRDIINETDKDPTLITMRLPETQRQLKFNFEIYNSANRTVDGTNLQVAVIFPIEFEVFSVSSIRLPPDQSKVMYLLPPIGKIWPTGWVVVPLVLPIENIEKLYNNIYSCCLRVFTDIGVKDHPFLFQIISKN